MGLFVLLGALNGISSLFLWRTWVMLNGARSHLRQTKALLERIWAREMERHLRLAEQDDDEGEEWKR